ncbi:hypothetical protein DNTS_004925, partial [Danionella cerebrum]
MACYHTDCVEKPLSKLFERLGYVVGSHPVWFIIIPLVLSAALGGGLLFIKECEDNDVENQFTPINGPSKQVRRLLQEIFPNNASMFSVQREFSEGKYAAFIYSVKNGSISNKREMDNVRKLNEKVHNLFVKVNETNISFKSICAEVNGICVPNPALEILGIQDINVSFPVHRWNGTDVFLGSSVGGLENRGGIIQKARAIRLFYFLQDKPGASEWLEEFQRFSQSVSLPENSNGASVSYFTSQSRQEEIEKHLTEPIPMFLITASISISFSVLACLRLDNVRNKIWVSFMGVLSVGLAVLSSFGLLLFLGVPLTNVKDPVEKRLGNAFKEAAVSITITTLTDVFGFYIGLLSDFRCVQAFCLYTSTAIIFCYIYNILFFGSVLAINGRREQSNRHWLTCRRIPSESPPGKPLLHQLCCVGGDYDQKSGTEKQQPIEHFFKYYYGPFLTKPWSKVCVIVLFLGYLAGSIYGCFQLQEGIDMRNLAADDSYVIRYYDTQREFFSRYGPNVMVAVTEEFRYWDEKSRDELNLCVKEMHNLSYVDATLSIPWFDLYRKFAQGKNITLHEENDFLKNLPAFFLLNPEFELDVSQSGGKIIASRFFIQTLNISNTSMEMLMFDELRGKAEICNATKLTAFHPSFIFMDQYSVIVISTVQNVGFTAAVMLVISLLLIPNPLCSLWVTFSIATVVTGVTGFMALWSVNLDFVSMIILVVCIGFTVDFTAHISYAFVSSQKRTLNERAVEALFSLGYPVLQGAASTIVGVVVLSTSKYHIFRTFFKIMLLVMLFGLAHSLIFIPVFLTLMSCSSNKADERTAVAEFMPKIIIPDNKQTAYDNYAFTKDNAA